MPNPRDNFDGMASRLPRFLRTFLEDIYHLSKVLLQAVAARHTASVRGFNVHRLEQKQLPTLSAPFTLAANQVAW
jgi:hypothetical protein